MSVRFFNDSAFPSLPPKERSQSWRQRGDPISSTEPVKAQGWRTPCEQGLSLSLLLGISDLDKRCVS